MILWFHNREETMALIDALNQAWLKKQERGWDKIYVAVDWHDTICKSTYDTDGPALDWCWGAEETLQYLSDDTRFCLILYTSSFRGVCDTFVKKLKEYHGINFEYINENPEVTNTDYGDFRDKFYFDLLFDDKAGFTGEDWCVVQDFILDKTE
jgi:hypothetical protein